MDGTSASSLLDAEHAGIAAHYSSADGGPLRGLFDVTLPGTLGDTAATLLSMDPSDVADRRIRANKAQEFCDEWASFAMADLCSELEQRATHIVERKEAVHAPSLYVPMPRPDAAVCSLAGRSGAKEIDGRRTPVPEDERLGRGIGRVGDQQGGRSCGYAGWLRTQIHDACPKLAQPGACRVADAE